MKGGGSEEKAFKGLKSKHGKVFIKCHIAGADMIDSRGYRAKYVGMSSTTGERSADVRGRRGSAGERGEGIHRTQAPP